MAVILISNDDGIDSPGIKALYEMVASIKGVRVIVVAPHQEQSGTSHSLTLNRPLRLKKVSDFVTKKTKTHRSLFYSVDGTPTDAVMVGVHKLIKKKPDLIISGINRGANLGEDVHYSGTVAAAMEGAIMGVPAMAVSMVGKPPYLFATARKVVPALVKGVLKNGMPLGVVLNVNIPNCESKKIKGIEPVFLGQHFYGDVLVENKDPRGERYFWIGGNPRHYLDRPGSDCNAILKNKITITPLCADITHYSFLESLKTWKL